MVARLEDPDLRGVTDGKPKGRMCFVIAAAQKGW